jgi:hypothetical protein
MLADLQLKEDTCPRRDRNSICIYTSSYVTGAAVHSQMGGAATKIAPDLDGPPPPINSLKPLARCSSSADLMVGQKVSGTGAADVQALDYVIQIHTE